ncbi:MAG: carboxypeptidase-like regulatory domain-containing protein, partial [Owenweeksia sp.]
MRRFLVLLVSLLLITTLPAQVRVSGQLLDAQSGEAIPYGLVLVHESGQQAETDEEGFFQLSIKSGNYHLHIEVSGYQAKDYDLKAQKDTTLIFRLKPTFLELQEVLVEESYSKTQQRKSSLSIEKVNLEDGEGGVES